VTGEYSFRLRALGALELRSAKNVEMHAVMAQPKRFALLLYLASADPPPPGLHRRDTLRALFWPDGDDDHARRALNRATYFLRHALGHNALLSRGNDELGVSEQFWCDAVAFENAAKNARFADALELYRGEFAPAFERQRKRLHDIAIDCALRLSEQEIGRRNAASAEKWARHAGRLAPYDERAIRLLVGILDQAGNRASALQSYEHFARVVRDELDLEPSPETQAVAEEIRARRALAPRLPVPRPDVLPRRGKLRRFIPRMAVLGAATIAMYALDRGVSVPLRPLDSDALAIMPFSVSGPPASSYLKTGMPDLLAMGLDGIAQWRVIHPRTVLAQVADSLGTIDPPYATRQARALGAANVVLGTVVAVGAELRFNADLYDVRTGQLLGHAQARANQSDPGAAIDSIAAALAKYRLRDHPGHLPRSVREYATSSAEALRAFLVAEHLIRRAEWRSAAESLARAIALDPAFGLAYFRQYLVQTYGASVQTFLSDFHPLQLLDRALPFLDRMPTRDRDLLETARAEQLGLRFEALRLANQLEQRYPDDAEAALEAGEEHFHFGLLTGDSPAHARLAFDRALRVDPGWLEPRLHAVELTGMAGNFEEAWSILRGGLALAPNDDLLRSLEIALRVSAEGVSAAVSQALKVAEWESRGPRAEWEILRILADDPGRAVRTADSLAILTATSERPVAERVRAWQRHAAYRLAQGRYEEAWEALERAERLAPGDPVTDARIAAYAFKTRKHQGEGWEAAAGLLARDTARRFLPQLLMLEQEFIRGDVVGLHHTLDRLATSCWWALHGCLHHTQYALTLKAGFRGFLALQRGDSTLARKLLTLACGIREVGEPFRIHLPDPAFSIQLARLDQAAGDLPAAAQHLADLFLPEALVYHAEGLELRAQIAEQRADTADEIRMQERFVSLWKDADPELQSRVDAARQTLSRLSARFSRSPTMLASPPRGGWRD
jgi:serine/threonine-protein kinase